MRTSRIAASGRCSRASATASSPSRASAQTSKPLSRSNAAQVEPDDRLVLGDQHARRAGGAEEPLADRNSVCPPRRLLPVHKKSPRRAHRPPEAPSPACATRRRPCSEGTARMRRVSTDGEAPLRRDVRLLGEILGRVIVEQEGQAFLDLEERIRALSRAGRARAAARRAARGGRGARPRDPGQDPARVRDLLPAREPRRAAPPTAAAARVRARGARPARVARGGVRPARGRGPRRPAAERLAASSSSPRTRPRRRGARSSPRTSGSRTGSPSSTTRACRARRRPGWRLASPRRSPPSGRPTRCATSGRASSTRSATGSGSSRRASGTRRRACSPPTGRTCPARRCRCASARGSAATQDGNPATGPRHGGGGARRGAPARAGAATATRCASWRARSASPRTSPAPPMSCSSRSRATSGSWPTTPPRSARRTRASRTGASCRSSGGACAPTTTRRPTRSSPTST